MANSKRSNSSELDARVAEAIRAHVPAGARLTLGLSGGVDSVLLLDALAAIGPGGGLQLACLHVHHALQADADRWAAFCLELGQRYGVPVAVARVHVDLGAGLGVEAAARASRYAAYRAAGANVVVLAHHRDDQAETVVLQLARGAGLAGLAAMPAWQPGTPAFLRPMLQVGRAAIEDDARRRGLEWMHDPSNDDQRRARNLVRHRVMPLLATLNPAAAANLARSAAHLAEAQALLTGLGRADLDAGARNGRIQADALARVGPARARNALRVHLADAGIAPPSTRLLDELLRQLLHARDDAGVRVELGGLRAHRFRGDLWLVAARSDPPADFTAAWPGASEWPLEALRGTLSFEAAVGDGLDARRVVPGAITVGLRRGGERLCIGRGRPSRPLKHLFQEAGPPPWERLGVPLVYCEGRLACVPGIGVDPGLAAGPGAPGVRVVWRPSH